MPPPPPPPPGFRRSLRFLWPPYQIVTPSTPSIHHQHALAQAQLPRSPSSRPTIPRRVNLAKNIEAGVADTPHLRPRCLRHLPHAQLAQDRDPGGIGGGGCILPQERRVPVHLLPQDDDVLARTRTVPQGGAVPVTSPSRSSHSRTPTRRPSISGQGATILPVRSGYASSSTTSPL
jgi:hypothetical protein